jgi:DNA primase small subunit
MEIGAVYSHAPSKHNTVTKEAYRPIERELVFDIDMDDYDDFRTCCSGSKLCMKCWTFMKAGIKVLDRALRQDFGFKHLLFVFSGRRGVHCWVCDKTARRLSNEQRSAVADYLTMVSPGKNKSQAEFKLYGAAELHPSITQAHKICEHYFRDDPQCVLQQQKILTQGPHLANILDTMLHSERQEVEKFLAAHPDATSQDIWAQLEQVAAKRTADTFKQQAETKILLKDVVIQLTYPRLDIMVSKQMNHLLKSPFVVHPKTGRVCVPIDIAKLDTFSPFDVPTVGRLVEELNRNGGDARQTSLKEYTHFFETFFLQPLEAACVEDLKDGPGAFDF